MLFIRRAKEREKAETITHHIRALNLNDTFHINGIKQSIEKEACFINFQDMMHFSVVAVDVVVVLVVVRLVIAPRDVSQGTGAVAGR